MYEKNLKKRPPNLSRMLIEMKVISFITEGNISPLSYSISTDFSTLKAQVRSKIR